MGLREQMGRSYLRNREMSLGASLGQEVGQEVSPEGAHEVDPLAARISL